MKTKPNKAKPSAQLCAAAPDLLAALEAVMLTTAVNLDDQEPEDIAAYHLALAAIEKARAK